MESHFLKLFVVFIFLCAGAANAGTAASLEEMISRAESVRSADPVEFRQLLREINAHEGSATRQQKEQIDYLNAYALAFAGRFDEAIVASRRLMEVTEDINLKVRASALIVNAYAMTRQFTDGLRQLEQTMLWLPQTSDPDLQVHTRISAGIIYNQIGQYQIGLDYAQRLLGETLPPRARCMAEYLRLESLLHLDRLPYDEKDIVSAIEQCLAEKEMVATSFGRAILARKWAAQGQRKKAIALLKSSLQDVEATGYPRLIGEVHSLLAQYLLEEEAVDAAEEHAQRAVAQSNGIAHSLPLVAAYRALYEIAERKGNPTAALSLFRQYAEADKAYLNDVKAREFAYQVVRQETLQKNQQINLLDQQNQVLQLQSKLDQEAAQNTRLLVILLVVLVASIGYWAYKIKRVQLSLKKMAETDALTGLCNRHHFTIQAERSLAQCARAGEEAALIMFDLDHFKLINDRFGHQTGDWVLKRLGEVCAGFCRQVDTLGRLGGEEFALLLVGCDLRAARRVAEDCRLRIAAIDSRESGHVFVITASFGVVSTLASGYSLARLLSHADKLLYRAKHLGRNCVCDSNEDVVTPLHAPVPELAAAADEELALRATS